MIAMKALDVEAQKVETAPYKGQDLKVEGVTIRWLSKVVGKDGIAYGLRYFTVEPGGEIPIHNHFYHQTMYILTGEFECRGYDVETDKMVEKRICGGGDMVYSPSMEPHGMKNVGSTPGSFLCCIANVYDDEKQ